MSQEEYANIWNVYVKDHILSDDSSPALVCSFIKRTHPQAQNLCVPGFIKSIPPKFMQHPEIRLAIREALNFPSVDEYDPTDVLEQVQLCSFDLDMFEHTDFTKIRVVHDLLIGKYVQHLSHVEQLTMLKPRVLTYILANFFISNELVQQLAVADKFPPEMIYLVAQNHPEHHMIVGKCMQEPQNMPTFEPAIEKILMMVQ